MNYLISVENKKYKIKKYDGSQWRDISTYVGLVTSVITGPREDDLKKQIVLTSDVDEAETFETLADAQDFVKELMLINAHYNYIIQEVRAVVRELHKNSSEFNK